MSTIRGDIKPSNGQSFDAKTIYLSIEAKSDTNSSKSNFEYGQQKIEGKLEKGVHKTL